MIRTLSPRRRGVTLIEVLCASIAGIAVLGALGGLYIMALTAHGTGTLVAESLIYEGRAEERLRTIQLIATTRANGSRFTILCGDNVAVGSNLIPDNRPRFISIAYDANTNHVDNVHQAAVAANANAASFPREDRAKTFLDSPLQDNKQSGVYFWYRGIGDIESNLYFIQLPLRRFNFRNMDKNAMEGFVTTQVNRNACELVAQNIVDFVVTPPGPGLNPVGLPGDVPDLDISWRIEYRAREF